MDPAVIVLAVMNFLALGVVVLILFKYAEATELLSRSIRFDSVDSMLHHEAEQREQLLNRMLVVMDETQMKLPLFQESQAQAPHKPEYVDEERELELERSDNGS